MNTSEKEFSGSFDVFNDEDLVNVGQVAPDGGEVGKPYKVPSLNARRRIEEYFEEKLLRNLTRGVFDD